MWRTNPLPFPSLRAYLLIKDDNVLLPEWLAYHYTFLPLRRLIVAVDPLSHTTPEPIFEKYRSIGMNITVWTNESTYWWKERAMAEHEKLDFVAKNTTTHQTLHWRYKYRQKVFYTACLQQLHQEGRTWTAVVDTDEYVTFNHYDELNDEGPPTWCSRSNSTCKEEYKTSIRDGSHHRTKLDESTTAAQHIHTHADEAFDNIDKPCLVFARYLFISKDIGPGDYNIQDEVDHEFNTTLFHTLRYRYRTPLGEQQVNGKALVDVSRYGGQNVHNPHRVLGDKCTGYNKAQVHNALMSFRVHHYVGSWETFRSPGFDSKGISSFNSRNNQKNIVMDSLTPGYSRNTTWLTKFAHLVGKENALALTQEIRVQEEKELELAVLKHELWQ